MNTTRKTLTAGAVLALISLLLALVVLWWGSHRAGSESGIGNPSSRRIAEASPTNTFPVDLTRFVNGQLDAQWNSTTYPGDDLSELPRGMQTFDGVRFDIRGVIQLQGQIWKERGCPFPERVDGLSIGRLCHFVYLLHADGGAKALTGTKVASLVLNYDDGTQAELPIQHDIHVKDWWSYGRPPPSDPNTVVAWTGSNKATRRMGTNIRLYKTRFENPHPEKRVETIDYVSAMAPPGAFMVGLTVE